MHKLTEYMRETWQELGRNIIVGDRYQKNVRGIAVGAALIVLINVLTGIMNLRNGFHMAALSSLNLILAGLLILYLLIIRKNRHVALTVATIAIAIIYSFDAIIVTDGILIFWTILFPWAFCYLVSVKSGIYMSAYFSIVYLVLFYSPLSRVVEGKYPEIIMQRFPILYLVNAFLCIFIMVQYHRNTLHQMDYAEQLLEAKEAADKANSAKGEFLANMSHEIRTPINAVLGMNEMILRESRQARNTSARDPEAARTAFENISVYAGDVESAGHNLLAIINDILDFSKIEAGRMDIVETPYQLSSVLNDVSNMILFKARDKGLEFIIDVDETLPDNLYGDEVRVRQIITNILGNAVKYTETGSVRLTLRGTREDGKLLLTAAVKDTGIGIRKENLDQLFTKFQRLDLRKNSTVEGTGLGLAITHSLLDMMGGKIDVESEYGKGSVFTVTIPQKIVSDEPMGDFQKRFEENVLEAREYHESFRAPEADILIVDDTKMNLSVAVNLLKNTRIRIDTASSGEDAIGLAAKKAYDVILMDQRMPVMDGTEALHRIRGSEDGPNAETPVICLTADAVIGAKERYIAEGFSDYLTKPINSWALEKLLMKYLPADKVVIVREEVEATGAENPSAPSGEDGYAPLRTAGIDPQTGLQYAQNDDAFYRSLLAEYAGSAAEKTDGMDRFFAEADWKNYAVLVHALKSTSKMIGAEDLSKEAARLEAAANAGDGAAIREAHRSLMERYAAVTAAILEILPPAEPSAADTEDVLEFAPE